MLHVRRSGSSFCALHGVGGIQRVQEQALANIGDNAVALCPLRWRGMLLRARSAKTILPAPQGAQVVLEANMCRLGLTVEGSVVVVVVPGALCWRVLMIRRTGKTRGWCPHSQQRVVGRSRDAQRAGRASSTRNRCH